MERIDPSTFRGPRAYFTSFDPRIVERTHNREKLRRDVERKLKVLLLVKSNVVCAASHLASSFVYAIFKDNPELLSEGHIIPAFRVDKQDLSELFERKRFPGKDDAMKFYNEYVAKTVNWELQENSGWFRERFIAEVDNENSVIRRNLEGISPETLRLLVQELQSSQILERDQIERIAKDLPHTYRRVLLNFRELIYHISGARVVNCESSLPQENYIDYDLADLSQERTKLSEEQILWKLLLEAVLESFQRRALPIELLDALTFKDILMIRKPLLDSTFQGKYDQLVTTSVSSVGRKDSLLFDVNELEKIRQELSKTFKMVLEEEVPRRMEKQFREHRSGLMSELVSVALGVLGLFPLVGSVSGVMGLAKESPALICNLGQFRRSAASIHDTDLYVDYRDAAFKASIERAKVSSKTELVDMMEMLLSLIRSKMEV